MGRYCQALSNSSMTIVASSVSEGVPDHLLIFVTTESRLSRIGSFLGCPQALVEPGPSELRSVGIFRLDDAVGVHNQPVPPPPG